MNTPMMTATMFLLQTLFDLYLMVLILRIILQLVRADFYNPISQFVVRLTNPVITPLSKYIPRYKTFDSATFVFAFLLNAVKLTLTLWLVTGSWPNPVGLIIWTMGDLLAHVINIFFWAIILEVLLSLLSGGQGTPLSGVLYQITSPIMSPLRRLVPPMGGLDITPIPALILLQLGTILLAAPLSQLGTMLAN